MIIISQVRLLFPGRSPPLTVLLFGLLISVMKIDEDRLGVPTVRALESAGVLSEMQKDCSWFLCIRNATFENFIG